MGGIVHEDIEPHAYKKSRGSEEPVVNALEDTDHAPQSLRNEIEIVQGLGSQLTSTLI